MCSKWDKNFPLASSNGYSLERGTLKKIKSVAGKKWKFHLFLSYLFFYWKGSLLLLRTTVWTFCFWCGKVNFEQGKVLVTQSCLTLRDPMDYSPPGSSVEFSRQEYWSGLPFPSVGDLSHWGIEPRSPALEADSLPSEPKPKNKQIGPQITEFQTKTP